MHSPFVFNFILDVLNNRQGYAPPEELEALRKKLLRDKRLLQIEDFGAGSRTAATKQRTVAQLAATAVKPPKFSRLLYRLVRHYQPQNIVELGTSLGLTTAYLAKANPEATIYTIEGSSAIHAVAQENFAQLHLNNIEAMQGNFDLVLPPLLSTIPAVDLAYIDANHRYGPTVNYFEQFLQKGHNDSIFVFDDIHWSAEMEQAWAEIKNHPAVRCSVDLFFVGVVFLISEFVEKQKFYISF